MSGYTRAKAFETVARSLREFGYPDVSPDMIKDTYDAIAAGKKEMPHGIVGMFAESQLREVWSQLQRMPA